MVMAAAASALFGCSAPIMLSNKTLRTKDGGEITKRVFNNGNVTYQRGYGTAVESIPGQPSYLAAQRDFSEAEEASEFEVGKKAAAPAREALAPAPGSPQAAPPGGTTPIGPKIDLPTQTLQPPSGPSHLPSGTYPPSGTYSH